MQRCPCRNHSKMKQALKTLLAEGKTAQALAELRKLSLTDSDLSHSIIQISARFAEMERQQHAGTLAQEALGIERNKINAAVLAVIDRLDDNYGLDSSDGLTWSQAITTTVKAGIVQNTEKQYNIDQINEANFGIKIDGSENVIADSKIAAGRDIHIGPKQLETIIENQTIINASKQALPTELTINLPKVEDLSKIIGREKDLEQLRELLQQKLKVVVVNGLGGIGKTTLAQAYLTQYGGEYAHLL